MTSHLIREDSWQSDDHFLLDSQPYLDNTNSRKWYNKHFSTIIHLISLLIIGSILWVCFHSNRNPLEPNPQHNNARMLLSTQNTPRPLNSELVIKNLIDKTPDVVYYFESGIRKLSEHRTINCVVLSRYEVFPNTTKHQTHQHDFCLEEHDDFGAHKPVMIANDKYLIACFDLIQKDDDYCLFVRFDDNANGPIKIVVDFNSDKLFFNDVQMSGNNLKSFAFYGDQLFGVNMVTQQHLYHWNVSDTANNFVFNQIDDDMGILCGDLDLEDSQYPVRLEVHNGFIYLFQRFENAEGVEVSKISYINNTIEATGDKWLYDHGHESLFDDFNKIHGFIFDPQMQKYFMFSDCEMIIENNTALNTVDFCLDSDFIQFESDGNWSSYFHIKIPITTSGDNDTSFVFDEKIAFLDAEITENQWILQLDYTHNFVYFPIQFKENYDSLYFMELDDYKWSEQSISVKFHSLSVDKNPFDHLIDETLQVVSGKDIAIQNILDKMSIVKDEKELNEVVNKFSVHKWADALYQILQTNNIHTK
eukprot:375804_1